jgi:UDP-glucose 4-epimerase
MATFLITGGCGFIGSHLSSALRARGDEVRVLDNLSTGHPDNLAPGAELIVADLTDPGALRAAMVGVDGCFHLAAIASVEKGTRDWYGTHRTNLSGTIATFDAAREESEVRGAPVPVVYASSAAVYGDPRSLPLREEDVPRPLSAYGADKLGCELHARIGGAVHGLQTAGLRFFNVFGPRQDPRSPYSGVVSIFCGRLARGEPLDIYGDGGQTRDFVNVSDVVAALLAASRHASAMAPVFNVCTGAGTSVLELTVHLGRIWGVEPEINYKPSRAGEIRHSVGSREACASALGLRETLPIEDGLRDLADWFRNGQPRLVQSSLVSRVLEGAHP